MQTPWITVRTRRFSMRIDRRVPPVLLLTLLTTLAVMVINMGVGEYPIGPLDVMKTVLRLPTDNSDYDFIVNTLRLPRMLVAALGAGWAVKRFGRKAALVSFALLQAVTLLVLLGPAYGNTSDLVVALAVGAIFFGYSPAFTVLSTVMMDKTRQNTAGTDYTVQYSAMSLVSFAVGGLGLTLAGVLGYVTTIIIAATCGLLGAGVVLTLYHPAKAETETVLEGTFSA